MSYKCIINIDPIADHIQNQWEGEGSSHSEQCTLGVGNLGVNSDSWRWYKSHAYSRLTWTSLLCCLFNVDGCALQSSAWVHHCLFVLLRWEQWGRARESSQKVLTGGLRDTWSFCLYPPSLPLPLQVNYIYIYIKSNEVLFLFHCCMQGFSRRLLFCFDVLLCSGGIEAPSTVGFFVLPHAKCFICSFVTLQSNL